MPSNRKVLNMSIIFNKELNIFHIFNNEISYYIYLNENGMLTNPYFGKRLDDIDIDSIFDISHDWQSHYFDNEKKEEEELKNIQFNSSPFIAPTSLAYDTRHNFIEINSEKGSRLDFRYISHRINKGKPKFDVLPFVRDDDEEASTLEFTLKEKQKEIYLQLSFTIFSDLNLIIRNTKLINKENSSIYIRRLDSLSQDFLRNDFDIIHFPGEWMFERQFCRESLEKGEKCIVSRTGRSSHENNPFVILLDKDANENYGEAYGFSFLWSGSFRFDIESSLTNVTRLTLGLGEELNFEIKSNDEFLVPEGIMVYSPYGTGNISRTLHDLIRNRIVKEANEKVYKEILLNSWEGCYLNFDTKKVLDYLDSANLIGTKLFVLDDGWFGKRDTDDRSLGDWFVNKSKINLDLVIEKCHELNMDFGIWIEPEMINQNSELYKKYPDFAGFLEHNESFLSRHQQFLNMGDDNCVDYIYGELEKLLSTYKIDYVKWDHNRIINDYYAKNLDIKNQGEFIYRNTLGYYKLIKKLREKFPNIHFQGCASGGGRFDLGTLFYFSDIWTSDENDPIQRLFIQYGTSFIYPFSVSGSHVNDNKITGFKEKCLIALFGSYGFELDPRKLSEKEIEEIKEVNEIYLKYHNDVVLKGDLYRLLSPFDMKYFAIDMVSKDKSKCLVLFSNLLKKGRNRFYLKLQGLDKNKSYKNSLDNKVHKGEFYLNVGLNLSKRLEEFETDLIVLEEA